MSLLRHHQLLMSAKSSGPATYYSTKLIARNSSSTPRYAAYNVPEFTTESVGAALGTISWYHSDSTHFATARYTETNTSGNCHVRNMSDDTSIFTVNPVGTTRTCMALSATEVFIGSIGSPYGTRRRLSDGAVLSLPAIAGSVYAARYSPDGTMLAICNAGSGPKARIIDAATGSLIWSDSQDFAAYFGVAWSADSTRVAFAEQTYNRGCKIVNATTGALITTVQTSRKWYGVEWCHDDSYIVLYGDSNLVILSASTYAEQSALPEVPASGILAGAVSADGRYVAINSTGAEQFRVYDLVTWSRVTVSGGLPSGSSSVRSLIFDAVPA